METVKNIKVCMECGQPTAARDWVCGACKKKERDMLVTELRGAEAEVEFGGVQRLSPRQREIYEMLLEGHTQSAIARKLDVSRQCVSQAICGLRKKAAKQIPALVTDTLEEKMVTRYGETVTKSQAGRILNISYPTITKHIRQGDFRVTKNGKIVTRSIAAWADGGQTSTTGQDHTTGRFSVQ